MISCRAEPTPLAPRWRLWQPAVGLVLALALGALPAAAQIKLFPAPQETTTPAPAPSEPPSPPVQPARPAAPAVAPPGLAEPLPPAAATPAVPPAAPSGQVQVEGLGAPSLETLGLREPGAGALSRDLWRGSEGERIVALYSDLPVQTTIRPLHDLTRRLLVTGGPIDGLAEDGQVLALRLAGLQAMGELAAAKALAGQLPPAEADTPLHRQQVELALLTGDDGTACRSIDALLAASQAAFWRELSVYCRLAAGDQAGAQLAADLLREDGKADPALPGLAALAMAQTDELPTLARLRPLHLALLRRAGRALPAAAATNSDGGVLAAALADPKLRAELGPAEAEPAFQRGLINGAALGTIYLAAKPAKAEADLLQQIEQDWGPATRTRLRQALEQEPVELVRTELLQAAWQASDGAERLMVAAAFAPAIAKLRPAHGLAFAAASVARARLAAGDAQGAAAWQAVLTNERTLAAEAAAARLGPLLTLAARSGQAAADGVDPAVVNALREHHAEGELPEPMLELAFALLEGAGYPIEPALWQALLQPPFTAVQAQLPPARLWPALDEAAAAKRPGETLLIVLQMLAGRPEAAHPEVLRRCLNALRAIGFAQEASAVALATAIAAGL